MNKLDIMKSFSKIRKDISNKETVQLLIALQNIKSSIYLGDAEQYKDSSATLPDVYPSDLLNLKPFTGYISVEITNDDGTVTGTGRTIVYSAKVINGNLLVGISMSYSTIDVILKWDFETNSFKRLRNVLINKLEEEFGSTFDEVSNNVSFAVAILVKEMLNYELIVEEYEPTSYSFTKKVPLSERHFHRKYRLVKPAILESVREENESKLLSKGLKRDVALKAMRPTIPEHLYRQLSESVWFSGLSIQMDDLASYPVPSISDLPFENFTVTSDFFSNGRAPVNAMVNVTRSNAGLQLVIFVARKISRSTIYIPLCQLNLTAGWICTVTKMITTEYITAEQSRELRESGIHLAAMARQILAEFLSKVFSYETEKVSGRFVKDPRGPNLKEREPPLIPKNVHIVLDMSKRRTTPLTGRSRICGYHMPEHTRIAHERTNSRGEKYKVKGSVINEGMGEIYGRVTKEYKL